MHESELKPLRETLQEQGIKYLIPSYVDMHGVPKTKMVRSRISSA